MRKTTLLSVALFVAFLSIFSINANAAFVTLTGRIVIGWNNKGLDDAVVTASPTISCGSWSGTSGGTDEFGYYALSVPDDCNFYIAPTRTDYYFNPVYYYVTPSTVGNAFNFTAIYDGTQWFREFKI